MATKHDLEILNSVFNPLLPIGECPYGDIVDEELKAFNIEEKTRLNMFRNNENGLSFIAAKRSIVVN
ncbi:hypothetical protein AVEN_221541-1 [Araneus ventricosus]|uniref:Uncharacterized protein n=1 Tax=Araneus ventricosus TaxID=182803 RepID=A0A4Y2REM4_ARAVE|nr:hypothetical protein AVEN_221541-1 [Araneus ventricosus]